MNLEERYDWIRERMDFNQLASRLDQIENEAFRQLTKKLVDLNIQMGVDTGLTRQLAMETPRLGLTVVLPGRPPLIWINLIKHNNSTEKLVDTVVHESIHATSALLGRHPQLPEVDSAIPYNGEEICALTGTNKILREIGVSARAQIALNHVLLRAHRKLLNKLGCNQRFLNEREAEGISAAKFLLA